MSKNKTTEENKLNLQTIKHIQKKSFKEKIKED